jgi:adenylosuccinate lyase
MRAIWTEENKLSLWLDIEEFASESLVTQGVVPKKDFLKIQKGCQAWKGDTAGLVARQRELEKVLNHDVIAFTTAVTERINDPASRWLHFGLTSSDIVDTAFAVQMVQSIDLLIRDVETLLPIIARRAREYQRTPCIGRSHGIHGEPTTFGLKLALMHEEFSRALTRFQHLRSVVAIGKLSGAVGTHAHLPPSVEAHVCKRLGLKPAPIATQVIWLSWPRASSTGPWSFATCNAPRFWRLRNPSPVARRAAAPCLTSATPSPGNASPVWPV